MGLKHTYFQIKPIPLPAGEVASTTNPQCFYVPSVNDDSPPPPVVKIPKPMLAAEKVKTISPAITISRKSGATLATVCDVCQDPGSNTDAVRYVILAQAL